MNIDLIKCWTRFSWRQICTRHRLPAEVCETINRKFCWNISESGEKKHIVKSAEKIILKWTVLYTSLPQRWWYGKVLNRNLFPILTIGIAVGYARAFPHLTQCWCCFRKIYSCFSRIECGWWLCVTTKTDRFSNICLSTCPISRKPLHSLVLRLQWFKHVHRFDFVFFISSSASRFIRHQVQVCFTKFHWAEIVSILFFHNDGKSCLIKTVKICVVIKSWVKKSEAI